MVEKKDYESLDCIDNDTDVCNALEDYTGYICIDNNDDFDRITEVVKEFIEELQEQEVE